MFFLSSWIPFYYLPYLYIYLLITEFIFSLDVLHILAANNIQNFEITMNVELKKFGT